MMRSTILMTSVAVAALSSAAFAGPDRYDQGSSCTGGMTCVQEQMRLQDGNRLSDKPGTSPIDNNGAAAGNNVNTSISNDSDDFGDEVGEEADEAGDAVVGVANEAGDEIGDAADEAGDAIGEAADEAGDAISDAFD